MPHASRLAPICLACLSLALTACAPAGAPLPPTLAPLPEAMLRPCARPLDFLPGTGADLSRAETEILAGRLGDALADCGAEKAGLAAWARGVIADLEG